MACSTAAKSSMKVIRSCSAPTSLLYLCCARLRQLVPDCIDILDVLPLPPGLRQLLHNKLGWVLSLSSGSTEETSEGPERSSRLPGPSSAGPSFSESDSEGCTSDAEACQRKRCRWTWLSSLNTTSSQNADRHCCCPTSVACFHPALFSHQCSSWGKKTKQDWSSRKRGSSLENRNPACIFFLLWNVLMPFRQIHICRIVSL